MKINTPEISWHAKEAIYSVDIQAKQEDQPLRVATAGIDSNVRIWELNPEYKTGVSFLSNLSRHEKAVNVVRFSKSGKVLASGGDDGNIVLWKLSDKNEAPNIFEDDSEIGKNIETWNAYKVLRGHLEDINDLCWSENENFMISGSIDHTAILWDITKGSKMGIMSEAKHYINGVAYDPLGQYAAVMSCDRSLRIYNIHSRKVLHNVRKMVYPEPEESNDDMQVDGEDSPATKSQRMFHDESVVRRRLDFSCDGNLLIVPSGCLTRKQGDQPEQINTAYIFSRGCLSKPAVVLPGFKQPVTVIRCCPKKFQLRSDIPSSINLPYRLVFAVASIDTVLLYDTQCLEPIALVGNIHYAALTDVAWSADGHHLIISSRDGFCTMVQFKENELGQIYTEDSPVSQDITLCNGVENSTDSNSIESGDFPGKITVENTATDEPMEMAQQEPSLSNGAVVGDTGNEFGCKDGEKNGTVEKTESNDAELSRESEPSSTSSQEKKPRRVQLIQVSDSPGIKAPRRVQLTTISSPKVEDCKDKPPSSQNASKNAVNLDVSVNDNPRSSVTLIAEGNSVQQLPTKKTPRRIQLTPVNN